MTVDLREKQIKADGGFTCGFEVDEFRRRCLLNGWDDISLTLRHEDLISQFESRSAPPLTSSPS
jgi:3-isopropylmalate/(R)-2-methylmalate dehydratase small subunit